MRRAPIDDAPRGRPLRAALRQVLWHAFVVLVSSGTCVGALWLMPRSAGWLLSAALAATGRHARAPHRTWTAGAMFLAHLGLLITGVALSSGAVPPWISDETVRRVVAVVLAVALPAAIAAAYSPFALAPLALLDGAGGVGAALERSFELGARRGAAASVRSAAAMGACVGVSVHLATLLPWHGGLVLLACIAAWAAGSTALLAGVALALAGSYAAPSRPRPPASEPPAARPGEAPSATRRLGTVLALLLPALLSVVVALIAALVTPTPMRAAGAGDAVLAARWSPLAQGAEVLELPGPHGLRVRRVDRGVWIETADGGGAGFVADGTTTASDPAQLLAVRTRFRSRDALAVYVADAVGGHRVVHFDERGVRLDDELSDRLSERVGSNTLAALCLAIALALAWGLRLLRARVDALALDAPAVTLASPVAAGAPSRLEGRLRLGAGSAVRIGDLRARLDGDARVVSRDGDLIVAMPPEVRLFAPDDQRSLEDGAEVEIVGHLGALGPVGLREGALEWPAGARLLVGQRDAAAERVIARAARGGAVVAAVIASLLVLVAVSIALAL